MIKIIFILILFTSVTSAQKIKGLVADSNNEPIALVMVQLLDKEQNLLHYTYTDEKGLFEFDIMLNNKKVQFILIQSLFHKEQRLPFNNEEFISIVLLESTEKLKEVVIKAEKISRDTIALGLSNRNIDRTDKVEDALKKIPGINVDKDGKISYLNKEIDKILIDGDDLAGSQYTFISRNLRAEVLEEIEVLKNYEENTILRNIQNSDKVALNLRLKDSYKNIWFGNIDGIYGNNFKNKEEFKSTGTVSLLNSKIKLIGAGRYSTLGDRSIINKIYDTGDKPSIANNKPFYNVRSVNTPLNEYVSNFNEASSTTLLLNKNVGKYNVRSTNYVGSDNLDQFYNSITVYPFQDRDTLIEDFSNSQQIFTLQGDVTINAKEAKRNYFRSTTSYDLEKNKGLSNLQVSNQALSDSLEQESFKIRNINELTTLLNNNLVIESYFNMEFNSITENVMVQSSELLFPSLFDSNSITQEMDRNAFLIDLGSSTRVRIRKSILKLGVGASYWSDQFKSQSVPTNIGFDFKENFDRLNIRLPLTYLFKIKRSTSLNIEIQPRYSILNNEGFSLLDYSAEFNTVYLGEWTLAYFHKNSLPSNEQLITGTIISSTNTITRPDVPQEPVTRDVLSLNHKLRNRSSTIENEVTLEWNRSVPVLVTNVELQGNFNLVNLDLVRQNQNAFNLKEQLVWLFDSYGLNFSTNHSLIFTPVTSINDLTSSIFLSTYDMKINSYYNSGFNFEVQARYLKSVQKLENIKNRFENYSLELNLSYEANPELDFSLSNYISSINGNTYKIVNLESNYVPKEKNYSISAGIFNLLNEDQFITQQRETFYFSTTSVPLRNRLPYIKFTYTF